MSFIASVISLLIRSTGTVITSLVLSLQFFGSLGFLPSGDHKDETVYQWVQAIPVGYGRDEDHWKEGTWPQIYVQPIVLNDTLLMIGSRYTWKSSDGIRWKAFRHDGKWGKRFGAALAGFSGKVWLMGGAKGWERFENDVWSSEDALHWTLVTTSAPWTPRRGHAVLAYNERMWIVGGAASSGKLEALPTHSLDDVWSSVDGQKWECVGRNAPWQAEYSREFFSTSVLGHVFDGKLWILGGPQRNGVWCSTDGSQWTLASEAAPWPARTGRGSAVFNKKLWVFGGPGLNDVWSSDDGHTWNQVANAPWSPRAPYRTVVFRERLWMFGAKPGNQGERRPTDDVWFLSPNSK